MKQSESATSIVNCIPQKSDDEQVKIVIITSYHFRHQVEVFSVQQFP